MYCSKCGKQLLNGKCNDCEIKNNHIKEITSSVSFYIVNLIYVVLMFSLQFISLSNIINNSIVNIILSLIYIIISYMFIISIEIIFIKAKLPWYGTFIPIYGEYLMCKLCFKKGYIYLIPILTYILILLELFLQMFGYLEFNILLFFICYLILIIYSCFVLYNIGKRFGMSGWVTLFFIYITLPILAFSKDYQYKD